LTARLEKTVLSEKMIKEDLSRVEESVTKSTYRLGVGFEMCDDKSEKSAPKFIPSSTYHKEEATIKFIPRVDGAPYHFPISFHIS
jgi:hypothetical protein